MEMEIKRKIRSAGWKNRSEACLEDTYSMYNICLDPSDMDIAVKNVMTDDKDKGHTAARIDPMGKPKTSEKYSDDTDR